jgi:hypothetical protein
LKLNEGIMVRTDKHLLTALLKNKDLSDKDNNIIIDIIEYLTVNYKYNYTEKIEKDRLNGIQIDYKYNIYQNSNFITYYLKRLIYSKALIENYSHTTMDTKKIDYIKYINYELQHIYHEWNLH